MSVVGETLIVVVLVAVSAALAWVALDMAMLKHRPRKEERDGSDDDIMHLYTAAEWRKKAADVRERARNAVGKYDILVPGFLADEKRFLGYAERLEAEAMKDEGANHEDVGTAHPFRRPARSEVGS